MRRYLQEEEHERVMFRGSFATNRPGGMGRLVLQFNCGWQLLYSESAP